MDKSELKPIVESLIFASDVPLTIDKIRQVLENVSKKEIEETIRELQHEYATHARGFNLKEVANGFQFRTLPEYAQWVKKLKKSKALRLTQPTLETLAIISYKQPITRMEIEKIRGVDCDGVIKTLLERKLITIAGRKDIPGKPFIFSTTKTFLEVFGLESLSSLPSIQEVEDLDNAQLPSLLRDTLAQVEEPDEGEYTISEVSARSDDNAAGEGTGENSFLEDLPDSPVPEAASSKTSSTDKDSSE